MLVPLGRVAMQALTKWISERDAEYGEWAVRVLECYAYDEREREAIVERFDPMFNGVRGVLCHHNPMQFGVELPREYKMYDSQVQGILARRPDVRSRQEVLRTVHEEFGRWIVPEIVGEMQRYSSIAQDVWDFYQTDGNA